MRIDKKEIHKAKDELVEVASELLAAAKKIDPDRPFLHYQEKYNLLQTIKVHVIDGLQRMRSRGLYESQLSEDRTSAVMSPTNNQKKVLTKIIAAATPETAARDISQGRQLVAARDMLLRLNLIALSDGKAEVTDAGKDVMRNQNLIDAGGSLTDEGNKYAFHGEQQNEGLIQTINRQSYS